MDAPNSPSETPRPPGQAASASRRRLIQGGLTAVPLVMTVSSQSVMAQGVSGRCSTASAFGSMNASRPANVTSCRGRGPQYWRNQHNFDEWPHGYVPRATQTPRVQATSFATCFGGSGVQAGATLLDVLRSNSSGRDEVARLCTAALLNAAKGLTPATVLSVATVRDVWQSYASRGYYEPTAGIRWYADASEPAGTGGIVEWLQTTMPR
jgi:hypothetical protein